MSRNAIRERAPHPNETSLTPWQCARCGTRVLERDATFDYAVNPGHCVALCLTCSPPVVAGEDDLRGAVGT